MKNENFYWIGKKQTRKLFKNNFTLYFKYMVFMVAFMITRITILFYPLGRLSEEQLVKNLKEYRSFKLDTLFDQIEDKEKVKNTLLVHVIKVLIMLSIGIIIYTVFWSLRNLGNMIDLNSYFEEKYIKYIFITPPLLVGLGFAIYIHLIFEMATHLIVSKNMKLTNALVSSLEIMKNKNRVRLFLIYFLNILEIIVVFVLSVFFINMMDDQFSHQVAILITVVLEIFMLFVVTKVFITISISKRLLLNNLAKDYNYEKSEELPFEVLREQKLNELFDKSNEVI